MFKSNCKIDNLRACVYRYIVHVLYYLYVHVMLKSGKNRIFFKRLVYNNIKLSYYEFTTSDDFLYRYIGIIYDA